MSTPKHLASLQSYWKRHKAFPSMAKLTEVLGLSSSGGVFKVLGKLTEAGYLERVDGGRIAPTSKFFERPVVGHARAGLPQPASQDVHDEHINVEDFLVERPDRTSFVHVRGDSMKNAGLLDGDLVRCIAASSAWRWRLNMSGVTTLPQPEGCAVSSRCGGSKGGR